MVVVSAQVSALHPRCSHLERMLVPPARLLNAAGPQPLPPALTCAPLSRPPACSGTQVEAELNGLDREEAAEYLEALGVEEGGLKSLIRCGRAGLAHRSGAWPAGPAGECTEGRRAVPPLPSLTHNPPTHPTQPLIPSMCCPCVSHPRRATYRQLGLLTYFTSGEKETRAWTIKEGFTAPQAAGVIHTGERAAGQEAAPPGDVLPVSFVLLPSVCCLAYRPHHRPHPHLLPAPPAQTLKRGLSAPRPWRTLTMWRRAA